MEQLLIVEDDIGLNQGLCKALDVYKRQHLLFKIRIVSSVHRLFLGGQHKLSAIKSVTAVIQGLQITVTAVSYTHLHRPAQILQRNSPARGLHFFRKKAIPRIINRHFVLPSVNSFLEAYKFFH